MSWLMQLLVPLYLRALGKSADYGARSYVAAAHTSTDGHVSDGIVGRLVK